MAHKRKQKYPLDVDDRQSGLTTRRYWEKKKRPMQPKSAQQQHSKFKLAPFSFPYRKPPSPTTLQHIQASSLQMAVRTSLKHFYSLTQETQEGK